MIDPKLIREDPDVVRRSQARRNEPVELVDQAVAADQNRRSAIAQFESTRASQKKLGGQIAKATPEERQELLARTKELAAEVKQLQAAADEAEQQFHDVAMSLGNIVIDGVPSGGEDDLYVVEEWGTPRDFEAEGFEAKDHLEIGEQISALDMERGAKVSGSRFYFLTGPGAMLEFALIQHSLHKALEWGFEPMIAPALVKPSAMDGTGFLGQAAEDVYHLERDDMYLVGTAEVSLAGFHSDEILPGDTLPRHYAGFSSAFRREAGSYGKDTRGIFRVHWFDKFEMFVYCAPEDAEAEHQKLLDYEKDFLRSLEIPFQVLDVASGDLGLSAARKYDCYAWFPGQQRYREVTSTSNCTTFQARRLNIRLRDEDGVRPLATLNGTLCAMTRIIAAILENNQNADGSVTIPKALRPYLGGRERFEAK